MVNKNNLLGGNSLNIFTHKSWKIINWVGSLQFLSAPTTSNAFSLESLWYIAFLYATFCWYTMSNFMSQIFLKEVFKVYWCCAKNLVIDYFQDSAEALPILRVLELVFSYKGSQYCKNIKSKLLIFNDGLPIFLWARQFTGWAILGNGQVEFTRWANTVIYLPNLHTITWIVPPFGEGHNKPARLVFCAPFQNSNRFLELMK